MTKNDFLKESKEARIEALIKRFDLADYIDSHLIDNFEELQELDIFNVLDEYDNLEFQHSEMKKKNALMLDLLTRYNIMFKEMGKERDNFLYLKNLKRI